MNAITAMRENLQAGLKAFTVRFGGGTGTLNLGNWVDSNRPGNVHSTGPLQIHWFGTHLPYSDWVGPLYHNSAYMACLSAYIDAMPEAPPCVKVPDADGVKQVKHDHPLAQVFLNPNPYDDDIDLFAGLLVDYLGGGAAHLLPVWNNAQSDLAALYYIPANQLTAVTPMVPRPGDPPVLYYEWRLGGQIYPIRPEDLCCIKYGRDPENPHLGIGRGEILRREIFSDNEATNYGTAILKRFGVTNRVISPKDEMAAQAFNADAIVKIIAAQSTGDKRGSDVAFNTPLDIHESVNSPEKMALDKIRAYPETRVCAVMRVPAQVAGLKCGEDAKTYANYEMARAAFWTDSVLPLQRAFSRKITNQILWRLPKYRDRVWFGFDYAEVRALQPDMKLVVETETMVYEKGGQDRAEYRAAIGKKPRPEDEGVYYSAGGIAPEEDEEEEAVPPVKSLDATNEDGWLRRVSAEFAALESKNGNGVHA